MSESNQKVKSILEQSCFDLSLTTFWTSQMLAAVSKQSLCDLVDIHLGMANVFQRVIPNQTYCKRVKESLSILIMEITLKMDLPANLPLQKIRIYLEFYSLLLTLRCDPHCPTDHHSDKIRRLISQYWLLRTTAVLVQDPQKNYPSFFHSILKGLSNFVSSPSFIKCLKGILKQFVHSQQDCNAILLLFRNKNEAKAQTIVIRDRMGRGRKQIVQNCQRRSRDNRDSDYMRKHVLDQTRATDMYKTPQRNTYSDKELEGREKMSSATVQTSSIEEGSKEVQGEKFKFQSLKFMEERSKKTRTLTAGHMSKWVFKPKEYCRTRIIYFCSDNDQ